jgi:hypothetical protein
LRDAAVASFSRQAAGHFANRGSTNAAASTGTAGATNSTASTNTSSTAANLIKPLLPDVFENETRLELATRGASDADWGFAIKLPAERVEEWNKNLRSLAQLAGMQLAGNAAGTSESSGSPNWSASRDNYHFALSRNKDWTVLEGGFGTNRSDAKVFKEFESGLKKRPGKPILEADVNLPLLGALWNSPALAHRPNVKLTVLPREDGIRTEAFIDYPKPLNITPEKWVLPKELIHDPLIGFDAIQGVRALLSKSPLVRDLAPEKVPNQLFGWSIGQGPFNVFAAADVGNPSQVITNLLHKLMADVKTLPAGSLQVNTNHPAILWRGLPIVVPYVEQGAAPDSSYLVAGLFPIENYWTNKPPAELFEQLQQKNLVFYEWEITEQRLRQWRPIWQLDQMLNRRLFAESASDRWLQAAGKHLGNTITQVTLENPHRLKLIRQSQAGFDALELLLLAHAVDPNDITDPHALRPPGSQKKAPHATQPRQPARRPHTPATARPNPGARPAAPRSTAPATPAPAVPAPSH